MVVVMFNCITPNQSSSSAKSCFAMHSHCTFLVLYDVQKLLNDLLGWSSTVCEVQVMMFNSIFDEVIGLVCLVVETHNGCNSVSYTHLTLPTIYSV